MILGIGSDLVDMRRIESALGRYGVRFRERLFTGDELATADATAKPAASLAKRFAAKEACAKALGTGMSGGVWFRDIGVVRAPSGQPGIVLSGAAAARLQAMTPQGMCAVIHLSMTDDEPWAQAFVVIEARAC